MSKTLEVKRILIDLTETINDIDPVIAANVEEAGEKIMKIVSDLEIKLNLINLFTTAFCEHEIEDLNNAIKMFLNEDGVINENN